MILDLSVSVARPALSCPSILCRGSRSPEKGQLVKITWQWDQASVSSSELSPSPSPFPYIRLENGGVASFKSFCLAALFGIRFEEGRKGRKLSR